MFTALLDRLIARWPRAGVPLLWLRKHRKTRHTLFVLFWHLLGALTSIRAIMEVRTAQGAIAWAVSLNTVPYVSVPAYWIFGRSKFQGYVVARRNDLAHTSPAHQQYLTGVTNRELLANGLIGNSRAVEKLERLGIK